MSIKNTQKQQVKSIKTKVRIKAGLKIAPTS
jgi:hypothetical protein